MSSETKDETMSNLPNEGCHECGAKADHVMILGIRIDAPYTRLCTSCVLRLHPGYFCPICLTSYEEQPPSSTDPLIACSKPHCASLAHSHCVSRDAAYICPTCSNDASSSSSSSSFSFSDDHLAFVCATDITWANMIKNAFAEAPAVMDKIRNAREQRKRAAEPIDYLGSVEYQDQGSPKKKRKEKVVDHDDIITSDTVTDGGDDDGDKGTKGGDGDGGDADMLAEKMETSTSL